MKQLTGGYYACFSAQKENKKKFSEVHLLIYCFVLAFSLSLLKNNDLESFFFLLSTQNQGQVQCSTWKSSNCWLV